VGAGRGGGRDGWDGLGQAGGGPPLRHDARLSTTSRSPRPHALLPSSPRPASPLPPSPLPLLTSSPFPSFPRAGYDFLDYPRKAAVVLTNLLDGGVGRGGALGMVSRVRRDVLHEPARRTLTADPQQPHPKTENLYLLKRHEDY
jgi:hypothetical protein